MSDVVTPRLLSAKEVLQVTSISTSGLYRMMKFGTFPRSIQIGPQRVAWLESEVNEWVQQRVASRDAKAGE